MVRTVDGGVASHLEAPPGGATGGATGGRHLGAPPGGATSAVAGCACDSAANATRLWCEYAACVAAMVHPKPSPANKQVVQPIHRLPPPVLLHVSSLLTASVLWVNARTHAADEIPVAAHDSRHCQHIRKCFPEVESDGRPLESTSVRASDALHLSGQRFSDDATTNSQVLNSWAHRPYKLAACGDVRQPALQEFATITGHSHHPTAPKRGSRTGRHIVHGTRHCCCCCTSSSMFSHDTDVAVAPCCWEAHQLDLWSSSKCPWLPMTEHRFCTQGAETMYCQV